MNIIDRAMQHAAEQNRIAATIAQFNAAALHLRAVSHRLRGNRAQERIAQEGRARYSLRARVAMGIKAAS